jgi:hypothetical protein
VTLYSANDEIVDRVTLPAGYMFGEPVRSIIVMGKLYVEGGRADSFYGKGQFAEVVKDGHAS